MPKLPIIFLQVHCTAAKQMDGEGRAIYYFILLLLRDAGHGPGHGPHGHGHAGGLAQVASAIRGSGRGGGFCNQSADINIFRVSNRKLLRLLQRHFHPLPMARRRSHPCHPRHYGTFSTRRGLSQTQPSMRIEWNHKLIKRDLFAASKGFCQPPKTTHRRAQRKCAFVAPSPPLHPRPWLYVWALWN